MLYLVLGLVVFAVWMLYSLVDYRRRRLLYSSLRRLVRWEFWPMWAFYAPVVVYALLLGLHYRGLTLFTLANPGMPHAGIAMMPKSDIRGSFPSGNPEDAAYHGPGIDCKRRFLPHLHLPPKCGIREAGGLTDFRYPGNFDE